MRNRIGAPLLIVLLPLAFITFGGCTEKDSTLSDGDGDTDSPGDGEEDGDLNNDIDEASISEEEEEGGEIDDPCTERLTDNDPNYTRQCIGSCPDCREFPEDVLLSFFSSVGGTWNGCGGTHLEIKHDLSYSIYSCYPFLFQADLSGVAAQSEVDALISSILEDVGEYRVTQHLVANCCDGLRNELYMDTDPPVRKLESYHPTDERVVINQGPIYDFMWSKVQATLNEGSPLCEDYCAPSTTHAQTACFSEDALCDCQGTDTYMAPFLLSCRVICGQSEKHSLGCQLVDGVADCVCGEEPETDGDGEIE